MAFTTYEDWRKAIREAVAEEQAGDAQKLELLASILKEADDIQAVLTIARLMPAQEAMR